MNRMMIACTIGAQDSAAHTVSLTASIAEQELRPTPAKDRWTLRT